MKRIEFNLNLVLTIVLFSGIIFWNFKLKKAIKEVKNTALKADNVLDGRIDKVIKDFELYKKLRFENMTKKVDK